MIVCAYVLVCFLSAVYLKPKPPEDVANLKSFRPTYFSSASLDISVSFQHSFSVSLFHIHYLPAPNSGSVSECRLFPWVAMLIPDKFRRS